MENRKSQQLTSGLTTLSNGGPLAQKGKEDGRNRSPSLSRSLNERPQMIIKNEEVRYNNFAQPQSELSRQQPELGDSGSRRGELEDSA